MPRLGDDPRWAAIARQLAERLELAPRGLGRDYNAEATIRCLRDGVPPPCVTGHTVGQDALISRLSHAIDDTLAGRARRPVLVTGRSGEGRTHILQWAREEAARKHLAVAMLTPGVGDLASPIDLQGHLLAQVRIEGRRLDELASQPTHLAHARQWTKLLPQLTEGLTSSALWALSELWEAWRREDLALSLRILSWMKGERIDPESRRRFRLPARLLFAESYDGILRLVALLAKLFGVAGLVVTVDGGGREMISVLSTARGLRGVLVLSESPQVSQLPATGLVCLSAMEKRRLALLIRDDHIAAYHWPNADCLPRADIEGWADAARASSTREFVRQVVQELDMRLVSQEMA